MQPTGSFPTRFSKYSVSGSTVFLVFWVNLCSISDSSSATLSQITKKLLNICSLTFAMQISTTARQTNNCMQITTYISRCYCFRTHYFQNTHLIFYARHSTFGLYDATLYCHVAKFSFLFSQSGLQFWSFWSGYVWTGPNLNFTDKRAYKIRAELNIYKHFRDFKHFLPRERTLQATDYHHL